MMKAPLPTDFDILDAIYEHYYDQFAGFEDGVSTSRSTKVYVPIDVARVASWLGVDGDIVFGRLYYFLDRKHGYTQPDGTKVPLFTLAAGGDRHCVHFPLLASVVADLREGRQRHLTATVVSFLSLGVSIAAFVLSLLT